VGEQLQPTPSENEHNLETHSFHPPRAKNVLSYPIVQRSRYFRVKQRLRAGERTDLQPERHQAAACFNQH
jgi:hypothetical protein